MNEFLPLAQLRSRLIDQLHSLWMDGDATFSIDVCPSPEDIVTVATATDGILYTQYRSRYYVCMSPQISFSDDINRDIDFNPHQHYRQNAFLGGPVRWLFHKLSVLDRVLLWPPTRYHQLDGKWQFHPWELVQFSELMCQLRALDHQLPIGALVLDPHQVTDQKIMFECCTGVASGHRDFFLSDDACHVVYILHHHDMIQVSVPNPKERQSIVAGLDCLAPKIQNCSRY